MPDFEGKGTKARARCCFLGTFPRIRRNFMSGRIAPSKHFRFCPSSGIGSATVCRISSKNSAIIDLFLTDSLCDPSSLRGRILKSFGVFSLRLTALFSLSKRQAPRPRSLRNPWLHTRLPRTKFIFRCLASGSGLACNICITCHVDLVSKKPKIEMRRGNQLKKNVNMYGTVTSLTDCTHYVADSLFLFSVCTKSGWPARPFPLCQASAATSTACWGHLTGLQTVSSMS